MMALQIYTYHQTCRLVVMCPMTSMNTALLNAQDVATYHIMYKRCFSNTYVYVYLAILSSLAQQAWKNARVKKRGLKDTCGQSLSDEAGILW